MNDLELLDFSVNFCATEIGSRGLIPKANKERLLLFYSNVQGKKVNTKRISSHLNVVSKKAMLASYLIFSTKFNQEWFAPPLICDL